MWVKNPLGNKPRLIYSATSPISGEIKVWEDQSSRTLDVGGYLQSATSGAPEFEKRYWAKTAQEIGSRAKSPKRALVVGVGGGTILHLLSQKFPDLKITGIELDPEIINVGRRFFGLDEITNLNLVVEDGAKYIGGYQSNKFDLIFIDAYLGGDYPLSFEEEKFIQKVKKILNPGGLAVFNRTSGSNLNSFEKILERNFVGLEKIKIPLPGFLGGLGGNFLYVGHK